MDSDSEYEEKENQPIHSNVKQPKVTAAQYKQIEEFYLGHSEELIGRDVLNELWKLLADKLNNIGPPVYTTEEWRRKWTVHKYNNKKKCLKPLYVVENVYADADTRRLAQPTSSDNSFGKETDDIDRSILESVREISLKTFECQQEILVKLGEISTNQDKVIETLNLVIQNQEELHSKIT